MFCRPAQFVLSPAYAWELIVPLPDLGIALAASGRTLIALNRRRVDPVVRQGSVVYDSAVGTHKKRHV